MPAQDSVTTAPMASPTSPLLTRGWVILALASVTSAMTGPGQTIGVSVFIDHFVDDLGVSRSSVGVAYLIGTLVGASLLPMVGRYVDRRGVRIAQVIVGGLFAAALVNMSFVQGIVWLAIGFTGIRFLGQGSLSLVSTVTVQIRESLRWRPLASLRWYRLGSTS